MFNNPTITGDIRSYDDIKLRANPIEYLKEDGFYYATEYLIDFFNQWREHEEKIGRDLLRKTARGEALAKYLNADGLNLSGLTEDVQALLGLVLRGLNFAPYTWKTFEAIRVMLEEIGFSVLPLLNDVHVYSLLKQPEQYTIIAKRIGDSFVAPNSDVIAFVNIHENKEIILFDGLKSLADTVIAVAVYDYYPWLRLPTNIGLGSKADFGFGFFKDTVTQEKSLWIGDFEKGVTRTSLSSVDGRTWEPVSENQVFAQIVESDYKSFANVVIPDGENLVPVMVGGHFPSGVTSDIYWRKQEYAGLGSPYSFEKAHVGEFSPRQDAGAVWFKNKIWVIGGLGQDDANSVDVWNSPFTASDKTFSLINDTPPWSFLDETDKDVFGHCVVVFKDKMWFLGGQKSNNQFYNRIYSSEDGNNWVRATDPRWSPRSYFGAVSILGRIYVFGGKFVNKVDFTTTVYNDVWYTEDGVNWVEETKADFIGRSNFGYLADEDKRSIYVIGGKNASGTKLSDIWKHYVI